MVLGLICTPGPIVGGFVTQSHLGWRWTQWLTLIMAAASMLTAVIFVPETYAPIILSRRAKALSCHRSQLHRREGPPILPEILLAPARRPFETFLIYGD